MTQDIPQLRNNCEQTITRNYAGKIVFTPRCNKFQPLHSQTFPDAQTFERTREGKSWEICCDVEKKSWIYVTSTLLYRARNKSGRDLCMRTTISKDFLEKFTQQSLSPVHLEIMQRPNNCGTFLERFSNCFGVTKRTNMFYGFSLNLFLTMQGERRRQKATPAHEPNLIN